MNIVVLLGSIMYIIEGKSSGFSSIPRSIYWAIVTLTTVGYGDISPTTNLGQTIAAIIMIMGYAIIAVPGGIIISEIANISPELTVKVKKKSRDCVICEKNDLNITDQFCSNCGSKLN